MREVYKKTFGEDVINGTSETWGLDSEGELQGSFRPIGHPGVSPGRVPASTNRETDGMFSFSYGTRLATSTTVASCRNNWYVQIGYTGLAILTSRSTGHFDKGRAAWDLQARVPERRAYETCCHDRGARQIKFVEDLSLVRARIRWSMPTRQW